MLSNIYSAILLNKLRYLVGKKIHQMPFQAEIIFGLIIFRKFWKNVTYVQLILKNATLEKKNYSLCQLLVRKLTELPFIFLHMRKIRGKKESNIVIWWLRKITWHAKITWVANLNIEYDMRPNFLNFFINFWPIGHEKARRPMQLMLK